jgi:hypothetical protein
VQVLYNGDTDHIRMIPSKARALIALVGRTCVRCGVVAWRAS